LREYEQIWALLGNRQIEDLMDLPRVVEPEVLDTLDVFTEIVTPSILFDEHLSTLVVCRLVTLSLQHTVTAMLRASPTFGLRCLQARVSAITKMDSVSGSLAMTWLKSVA